MILTRNVAMRDILVKPRYRGRPLLCNLVIEIVRLWTVWFAGICALDRQRMSESQQAIANEVC